MLADRPSLELHAGRYLDRPGLSPARRDVSIRVSAQEIQTATALGGSGLVMPALVNAHDHGYGIRTLGFGGVDDALEAWIPGLQLRPEADPYLKALVAFGRLARGGVGATMHCHNALTSERLLDEAAAVARAARDVGIHLAFSCPLVDANPWIYGEPSSLRALMSDDDWVKLSPTLPSYRSPEEQIAAVEAVANAHHGSGVDVQYGPIGPQWCSEKLLGLVAEGSRRTGLRVHMHFLESPRQRAWLDRRYPQGIVRYLDEIGLLSPRLAVAHGVQLRPDECELLAERGVIVVTNPSANLRLLSGVAPVPSFIKAGLSFAIGLDGTGMDDDQDLWREIRLAYLLHGGQGMEREITASHIFEAVVKHGASVVNLPQSNNLVLVDYEAMTEDFMFDDLDEAEVLLTRMTQGYVSGLVVDGRWVVRENNLVNIDIDNCNKELIKFVKLLDCRKQDKINEIRKLKDVIRRYYA